MSDRPVGHVLQQSTSKVFRLPALTVSPSAPRFSTSRKGGSRRRQRWPSEARQATGGKHLVHMHPVPSPVAFEVFSRKCSLPSRRRLCWLRHTCQTAPCISRLGHAPPEKSVPSDKS